MSPPKQLHLILFQRCFIRVVNQAAEACVDQNPFVEMCPLLLRILMKKDAVLNAGNDQAFVPHIDSHDVSDMNGLIVVVAHARPLMVKLRGGHPGPMAPRAHNLAAPEAPNRKCLTDPSNDCEAAYYEQVYVVAHIV